MSSTLIKVHDYLIKGPFEGTRSDIAAAIGIDLGTFQSVLNTVRRDWFVYTYGWTIPYVGRGCAPGKWVAIETTDPFDARTFPNLTEISRIRGLPSVHKATS